MQLLSTLEASGQLFSLLEKNNKGAASSGFLNLTVPQGILHSPLGLGHLVQTHSGTWSGDQLY